MFLFFCLVSVFQRVESFNPGFFFDDISLFQRIEPFNPGKFFDDKFT